MTKSQLNPAVIVVLVGATFLLTLSAVVAFLVSGGIVSDSSFVSGSVVPPKDPNGCSGHAACKKIGDRISLAGGESCVCERTTGQLCRCKVEPKQNPTVKCPSDSATSPACRDAVVNSSVEYSPGRSCTCQLNAGQCGCVPNQKQQPGVSCTDGSECASGQCVDKICVRGVNTCTSGDSNCIAKEANTCLPVSASKVNYRCVSVGSRNCVAQVDASCDPVTNDTPNTPVTGPFTPPTNQPTQPISIATGIPVNCAYGSYQLLPEEKASCEAGYKYGQICVGINDPITGKRIAIDWTKPDCIPVINSAESGPTINPQFVVFSGVGQKCNDSTRRCANGLKCEDQDKTDNNKQRTCYVAEDYYCDTYKDGKGLRACASGLSCKKFGDSSNDYKCVKNA